MISPMAMLRAHVAITRLIKAYAAFPDHCLVYPFWVSIFIDFTLASLMTNAFLILASCTLRHIIVHSFLSPDFPLLRNSTISQVVNLFCTISSRRDIILDFNHLSNEDLIMFLRLQALFVHLLSLLQDLPSSLETDWSLIFLL